MRQIEMIAVQMEDGRMLDYRKQIIDILRLRDKGMDIAQMEQAIEAIGAIRRAGAYAILEEESYELLLQRLKETSWQIADPAILKFDKAIKAAPQFKADEEPPYKQWEREAIAGAEKEKVVVAEEARQE